MDWRVTAVLASLAMAGTGISLLAESRVSTSGYHEWRPGERFIITHETGNQTWAWSFRLPNEGADPLHVEVGYLFNVSIVKAGRRDEWNVVTRLLVDGEVVGGLDTGGNGCCSWTIEFPHHSWTIPPGQDSLVEARVENIGQQPERSVDWQVEYDPMRFQVTTTTLSLDWGLAGPGTTLLACASVALAVAAVPWRLKPSRTAASPGQKP